MPNELPAGRELDQAIAERVMGYADPVKAMITTHVSGELKRVPWVIYRTAPKEALECRNAAWDEDGNRIKFPYYLCHSYSASIEAAWRVVEHFKAKAWTDESYAPFRDTLARMSEAEGYLSVNPWEWLVAHCSNVPLAICLAALAALAAVESEAPR